jgi:7-cyano-7-deazaguanine reductase
MASIKLGETASYVSNYDPSLLEPIARSQSRILLLEGKGAPFIGLDIWTAYEVSWLLPGGKPQVAIAEFVFLADSDAIIESKSLKYYLNSLNQTRFESVAAVKAQLQADLTAASGADVQVTLYPVDAYPKALAPPQGSCVDDLQCEIDSYRPDSNMLVFNSTQVEGVCLYSHLLKSNCPVTGQPDWATVWIQYSGRELLPESYLRYVISFREHQDFHENCVEKIFCDLLAQGELDALAVYARYTRRGGLDINPYRATPNLGKDLPAALNMCRIARQ